MGHMEYGSDTAGFSALIAEHRATGHNVFDTFWDARCRDCSWVAHMAAVGQPFITNAFGGFVYDAHERAEDCGYGASDYFEHEASEVARLKDEHRSLMHSCATS